MAVVSLQITNGKKRRRDDLCSSLEANFISPNFYNFFFSQEPPPLSVLLHIPNFEKEFTTSPSDHSKNEERENKMKVEIFSSFFFFFSSPLLFFLSFEDDVFQPLLAPGAPGAPGHAGSGVWIQARRCGVVMKRLMIGKQGEREQAGWDEMPAGQSPRFSFDKKALFDLDPASLQQDHLYQMQVTYLRHRGVMSSFGGQGAELSSLLGHFRLGMTSSSPVPSVSWTPRRAPQCS